MPANDTWYADPVEWHDLCKAIMASTMIVTGSDVMCPARDDLVLDDDGEDAIQTAHAELLALCPEGYTNAEVEDALPSARLERTGRSPSLLRLLSILRIRLRQAGRRSNGSLPIDGVTASPCVHPLGGSLQRFR